MSKIIQIAACGNKNNASDLFALTEDGRVFEMFGTGVRDRHFAEITPDITPGVPAKSTEARSLPDHPGAFPQCPNTGKRFVVEVDRVGSASHVVTFDGRFIATCDNSAVSQMIVNALERTARSKEFELTNWQQVKAGKREQVNL